MMQGDDDNQSQLNSLKERMIADLPHLGRQVSQRGLGRAGPDERSYRGGRSSLASHHEADYESAFRLLQRASEAIDVLQDRCRRLEMEAHEVSERTRSEAESAERVIKDWERLATALKAHLANSDATNVETQAKLQAAEGREKALEELLKSTEERAQGLESRATAAEARAEAAEQRTAREIEVAKAFRDTIVQTFGVGSRLSAALAGDHGS